jgi:hypothetical protein
MEARASGMTQFPLALIKHFFPVFTDVFTHFNFESGKTGIQTKNGAFFSATGSTQPRPGPIQRAREYAARASTKSGRLRKG